MELHLRSGAPPANGLTINNLASGIGGALSVSLLPGDATPLQASSGNQAAATATATLAAAAGKTNYLTGFDITGSGATAGSVVLATVTGLLGGTRSYVVTVSTGVAVGNAPLVVNFTHPLPASAPNTAIVVSIPSLGAGSTNSVVNAQGWQL